jgi:hypothetical protein
MRFLSRQFLSSMNFTYQCVPSQKGLFLEEPHRQRVQCSLDSGVEPSGSISAIPPVTS